VSENPGISGIRCANRALIGALGAVDGGTGCVVDVVVEVDVDVVDVVVDVVLNVVVDVEGTPVEVVVASVDSGDESVVESPARSADAQLVRNAPATSVTTIQIWMGRGTGATAPARSPHVRYASRACALRPIAVVSGSCVMRRSSAPRCPGHQ